MLRIDPATVRAKEGAWYGWPDFAGTRPLTDAAFGGTRHGIDLQPRHVNTNARRYVNGQAYEALAVVRLPTSDIACWTATGAG